MSYQPRYEWMPWDELRSLRENEGRPPPSVSNAARFMCAGAAIEFLEVIIAFVTYRNLVGSVSAVGLTPSQWHLGEVFGGVYIVVTGLIGVAAWLWMAVKNRAGRRWARVLSTVFFVIESFVLVVVFVQRIPGGEWEMAFPVATWLVGLCAIVLLWQRQSSQFFDAQPRRY